MKDLQNWLQKKDEVVLSRLGIRPYTYFSHHRHLMNKEEVKICLNNGVPETN